MLTLVPICWPAELATPRHATPSGEGGRGSAVRVERPGDPGTRRRGVVVFLSPQEGSSGPSTPSARRPFYRVSTGPLGVLTRPPASLAQSCGDQRLSHSLSLPPPSLSLRFKTGVKFGFTSASPSNFPLPLCRQVESKHVDGRRTCSGDRISPQGPSEGAKGPAGIHRQELQNAKQQLST